MRTVQAMVQFDGFPGELRPRPVETTSRPRQRLSGIMRRTFSCSISALQVSCRPALSFSSCRTLSPSACQGSLPQHSLDSPDPPTCSSPPSQSTTPHLRRRSRSCRRCCGGRLLYQRLLLTLQNRFLALQSLLLALQLLCPLLRLLQGLCAPHCHTHSAHTHTYAGVLQDLAAGCIGGESSACSRMQRGGRAPARA